MKNFFIGIGITTVLAIGILSSAAIETEKKVETSPGTVEIQKVVDPGGNGG